MRPLRLQLEIDGCDYECLLLRQADDRLLLFAEPQTLSAPVQMPGAADELDRLRTELESAVHRFVAAESSTADLGAFLSGGTDSSTVAGMITRITGTAAKAFSIAPGTFRMAAFSSTPANVSAPR